MTATLIVLAGLSFDPAVAAAHAFAADLQRGNLAAARGRVKGWAKQFLADPKMFAGYWDALARCHGPFLGPADVARDKTSVSGRLRFERQDYVFAAAVGADGKLDQLQFVAYPVGGVMLLRASHGVPVSAADLKSPGEGVVTFAVPGRHADQVPLSLDVRADPPAALKGVKLRKRDDGINWVVEATVHPGRTGATVFWESAVLVRTEETEPVYGGRPPAPKPEVPPEAARWLRPTACVQSDDPGIVAQANKLWAKKPDVRDYAEAVAKWVSENNGTGKPFLTLDATAALGCGGSCTSRANLAAALFRARGIPARTVAHLPTWAGPLYVHWLTEYWHPGAGWRMVEPSRGDVYPNRCELVVLNVATPEDEDESVWPNRRSGVMAGAPRLSSRELDGPIRTTGTMGGDLRTWGLAVPLASLNDDDFRNRLTWIRDAVRGMTLGALGTRTAGMDLEFAARLERLARLVADLPGAIQGARVEHLWRAATAAHAGLTVNDPRRRTLVAATQTGGVSGLTAALRTPH